jgi:dipeptidyl aminopeptidase/acylaminoacyl peptidase
MINRFRIRLLCGFAIGLAMLILTTHPWAAPPQGFQRPGQGNTGVYKDRIAPHWFHDNTRFWYRNNLRDGAKEFVVVDAEAGTRTPAFDQSKLAAALSAASGEKYNADRLPFELIELNDAGKLVRFKVGDAIWQCDLNSYEVSKDTTGREFAAQPDLPAPFGRQPRTPGFEELTPETVADGTNLAHDPPFDHESKSPDGKSTAIVKDFNLVVRRSDGTEVKLTSDGTAKNLYGIPSWSPDSKTVVAFRIEPAEAHDEYHLESTPRGGAPRAVLRTRKYTLPGDKYTSYQLWTFDVDSQKPTKVDSPTIDFYGPPKIRWREDGKHFLYHQTDRGHQRFRIYEVDSHNGETRTVYDEQAKTFIDTTYDSFIYYTKGNAEILFASERDGWKHLYLINAETGNVKPITSGPWVMRGVTRVDEDKRQIWFRGCGKNAGEDPYLIHYYRVNFDGTGLVALTEGNGTHTVQYSPDQKYLIDMYSRVDAPPAHNLRRVADGSLACKLEEGDITELKERGWEAPEVFVAKGRDGTTDIWGIISRPPNFDPNKKYPVIEYIYAGPHDSYVPKAFSSARRWASLNDLGFIVVQMDGMGTANRSKAFHDVCWHNLGDAGFPDRILWHQAVAKKYPYYDISRVGIYGSSAGGQNAAGAVIFHPEFYKVAVAACGCHDNRMDKSSWNEQWMGYPVGPQYAESSNIEHARNLQGKLQLVVGELDMNVPPENTYRLADALIKAGKDFDLIVIPGAGHGSGGQYGERRRNDFFVHNLLGVEPPDRNAAKL